MENEKTENLSLRSDYKEREKDYGEFLRGSGSIVLTHNFDYQEVVEIFAKANIPLTKSNMASRVVRERAILKASGVKPSPLRSGEKPATETVKADKTVSTIKANAIKDEKVIKVIQDQINEKKTDNEIIAIFVKHNKQKPEQQFNIESVKLTLDSLRNPTSSKTELENLF